MNNSVTVSGVETIGNKKLILHLDVIYSGNQYYWKIMSDEDINLKTYITNEIKEQVYSEIRQKELEWENLNPKYTVFTVFGVGEQHIPILKETIVRPDVN